MTNDVTPPEGGRPLNDEERDAILNRFPDAGDLDNIRVYDNLPDDVDPSSLRGRRETSLEDMVFYLRNLWGSFGIGIYKDDDGLWGYFVDGSP